MDKTEIRLTCLRVAIEKFNETQQIIGAATQFTEFVTDETKTGEAGQPAFKFNVSNIVEVRVVSSPAEVNQLLDRGWRALSVNAGQLLMARYDLR